MNSSSSPTAPSFTLIALAGPPGGGKSTLASALRQVWGAPILDKDRVRAALFGPDGVEYSAEQDEHCAQVLYDTATWLARRGRTPIAILDGRTFARGRDVEHLLATVTADDGRVVFVECTADEAVLRDRLERDARARVHVAANRDASLLDHWLARREELHVPGGVAHVTLDTGRVPLDAQVAIVRETVARLDASRRGS